MSSDSASSGAGGAADLSARGVTVTHEGTVGPYAYVQLRSTSSESLLQWLPANGYVVPEAALPVVAAYVKEEFDFIALKLRPGFGTRQMTPVRVVTKGASPTLPLRMVAAGTGAFVGITLYVISEGRFETTGFKNGSIEAGRLTFDWLNSRSNYAELRREALEAAGGQTWLTTFAARGALSRTWADSLGQPITFSVDPTASPSNLPQNPAQTLTDLYIARASVNAGSRTLCSLPANFTSSARVVDTCVVADAPAPSPGAEEGRQLEGGTDGAGEAGANTEGARAPGEAGADAQPSSTVIPTQARVCTTARPGEIAATTLECNGFSDIAAATVGMHLADVWITRLEANLPRAALAQDLTLQSAASQTELSSALRAVKHVNPPCDLLEDHPLEAALQSQSRGGAPVAHASLGFLSALGLLVARRLARKSA